MQVTFLRAAASLPFLLLATASVRSLARSDSAPLALHVVRGCLAVVTLWFFVYAVRVLSLADAYTIFMSAPLLITALSVPMLGEHVGWRRWLAVVVGLARRDHRAQAVGHRTDHASAAWRRWLSAIGYALSAHHDPHPVAHRYRCGNRFLVVAGHDRSSAASLAAFQWVPLRWEHWHWIVGVGLFGAIGQYFITSAFRQAAPPVVAPIEYTALMWGMLFDWLLWLTDAERPHAVRRGDHRRQRAVRHLPRAV